MAMNISVATATCEWSSSVLIDTLPWVLTSLVWAYMLMMLREFADWKDLDLFTDASFREVGVAMSFLLVHRATVGYGLYWEGRGAIGMAGVHARNIVRITCSFAKASEDQELLQAMRKTLGRHCILYYSALRLKLEDADEETTKTTLQPLLAPEEDKTTAPALPTLLGWISRDIRFMLHMGWIAPPQSGDIEAEISQLNAFTAGAMKVHTQPFPLPYQQLMAFGLLVFTLLIPVPFILDWCWYIGVPTAVATTFLFGIEYLARKLSAPFKVDAAAPGLGFFDMSAMDAALEKDVTGLVAAAATYNLEAQKQIYAAQYASKYSRIL